MTVFEAQIAGMVGWVVQGWHWLAFLGAFMAVSWIADRWAHSNVSREMQYVGLGLYVLAEAIIFVPLLFIAQRFGPVRIVKFVHQLSQDTKVNHANHQGKAIRRRTRENRDMDELKFALGCGIFS